MRTFASGLDDGGVVLHTSIGDMPVDVEDRVDPRVAFEREHLIIDIPFIMGEKQDDVRPFFIPECLGVVLYDRCGVLERIALDGGGGDIVFITVTNGADDSDGAVRLLYDGVGVFSMRPSSVRIRAAGRPR